MKKISIIIFLAIATQAFAQQYCIRGNVADKASHESIPYANISLLNANDSSMVKGCISDESGNFLLSTNQKGSYILRISMVGYERLFEPIEISTNADFHLNTLYLKAGQLLSEVSIVSMKPIYSVDGEKNIYNTANDPSIQSGTAIDALQNAPSLSVDSEGNIRLRGTQTVSIWINGRECRMNEESLKQYLKTMTAQNIKSIEVISNPSARYGGSGPVVNIVTNRHSLQNQFLSLGCNGNTTPTLLPWTSYIFENDKWEFSLYANGGIANDSHYSNCSQILFSETHDTLQTSLIRTNRKSKEANAMISMDVCYKLDSLNNLFGWFALSPHWAGWESTTQGTRHQFYKRPGDYSFNENSSKPFALSSFDYLDGIWYEHLFDDTTPHSFSIGYFGSCWKSDSLVNLQRHYAALPNHDIQYRQNNTLQDLFHGIEALYCHPWGIYDTAQQSFINEFEIGFDGALTNKTNSCITDTLSNQQYRLCSFLSKETHLTKMEGNMFASYLHRWKKLTFKAALRTELSKQKLHYQNAPEFNTSHLYGCLIPSFHFTYSTQQQVFSASYTFRSSIPEIGSYSLYRTYHLDGFSVGNPLLQMPNTHIFESRWERFNQNQTATIGLLAHFHLNNSQIVNYENISFDSANLNQYIVYQLPVNLRQSYNTGLSLNLGFRPNAFLNIRFSTDLYYNQLYFQSPGLDCNNGMLCYAARLNFWTKLWGKLQIFANANYTSPTQTLFVTTLTHKTIDLGTNIDLLNHRLSINATINDIFNWNQWDKSSTHPLLSNDSQLKPLSRYISCSLTYRIGRIDLEQDKPIHRRNHSQ